jgi:hypothetical protein
MKMEHPAERGRSQFSKILPAAPQLPIPLLLPPPPHPKKSSSLVSTYSSVSRSINSPLPPVPEKTMPAMAIARRPVGGPTIHTKLPSVGSVSSVYSESPGFSRSLSDSSRRTKDSLSGVDDSEPATPPLPPKDSQRQQLAELPKHVLAAPTTSFQQSPPKPEIWRRRSLKNDNEITVPQLNLETSNGSTASPPRQVPSGRPRPSHLPRRPVPSRPAPPQPDAMGNKTSKLRGWGRRFSDHSSKDDESVLSQHAPFNRLPTPEYLQTDQQQPLTPNVLSPVSPETPPFDNRPPLPQKSESRLTGTVGSSVDTSNLTNDFSTSSHSRTTSSTLTVTSEPLVQPPQPKKAFPTRILTPQPSPSPSAITSPLELPSPLRHPGPTASFPRNSILLPEGTVFASPPLEIVHFECYQFHKFMRVSRNAIGPVGCMICQKRDPGKRWRCPWCCMGACGSCMEVLVSIPDRDLKTCLRMIGVITERE